MVYNGVGGCVCGRGDGGSARVGSKIASKKVFQNIIGKGASKVQSKIIV